MVSAVDNDFHESHNIFKLFDDLVVPGLDEVHEAADAVNGSGSANGHTNGHAGNGLPN